MAEDRTVQDGAVLDDVFHSLGWWGRYQRIQFLMTMLPVLPCALHTMSVIFIGREVGHRCADVPSLNLSVQNGDLWSQVDVINNATGLGLNVTYNQCSIDVINGSQVIHSTSCINGYHYDEPKENSFVSQWDLVCERSSLSDVTQTMLTLGMMAGAFVFTNLADMYGRKPSYMVSHLLLFGVALGIAFSPSYIFFIVLRFFLGAMQQGIGLTSNILVIEVLPKERRALRSQVGNFAWPLCLLVMCLVAYLTREVSWQYTEIVIALCSSFVLFQWWVVDESLRWLVANKRTVQAERILGKAAALNKVELSKVMAIFRGELHTREMKPTLDIVNTGCSDEASTPMRPVTDTHNELVSPGTAHTAQDQIRLMAFVKNKHIVFITLLSSYIWFTDSMTYYGLLMTSSSLTDDLYLGFFLSVLVELPGAVVFALLINRLGRRRCMIIFHLLGAVSLMVATVLSNLPAAEGIPGIKTVTLCVSLVGKFGVTVGFAVVWLYTPELYPTNLRNLGFGIGSLAARVGGIVAPFSRTFGRHVSWGPGAVFSGLCLLVPVMVYFLPETHGRELPQTLADMDKWFGPQDKDKDQDPTSALKANKVV